MNLRFKNLAAKLKTQNLDALLITSQANITYLTGYKSRDSYLLAHGGSGIFFTDSRYTEEAKKSLKGLGIQKIDGSFFKDISANCKTLKINRLGVEEKDIRLSEYNKLRQAVGKKIGLVPTDGLIEGLRQVKDSRELEKIKKATAITVKALEFIRKFLKPGRKEIEIAAELERFIRYEGAGASAFEIIVASGPNSCYPHHITGQRKAKDNEPVMIDMGAEYLGYKSDLTRVFFLGKMNFLQKRIYNIVLEAQSRAISQISPDSYVKGVDVAARGYIHTCGYGGFFGHSTGHGVGLETHEAPRLSAKVEKKLEAGMVVTVEPAIYLPGKFGIRIEDMVLVTKKGCEVLSGALNK